MDDGWVDAWTNRCMGIWMNGWRMDGWVDEYVEGMKVNKYL